MDYQWIEPTLARIADLLRMPGIHNSYATPAVSPGIAWAAVKLIWDKLGLQAPVPIVLPTDKGGLHVQWDGVQTSFMMTVDPDGVHAKAVSGNSDQIVASADESRDLLAATMPKIIAELQL